MPSSITFALVLSALGHRALLYWKGATMVKLKYIHEKQDLGQIYIADLATQ